MKAHVLAMITFLSSFRLVAAPLPFGHLVGWGDSDGFLDHGTPSHEKATNAVLIAGGVLTNVVAVGAGDYHIIALTTDGTVFGMGGNLDGMAVGYDAAYPDNTNGWVRLENRPLTSVTAVAAGNSFSVALRDNGSVVSWGSKEIRSGVSGVAAISAGGLHALALKRDGSVTNLGMGPNSFAGLSNVVAVSVARSWFWNDTCLTSDGKIIEHQSMGEVVVPTEATNFVAISAGYAHSLALRSDGMVFGWGNNDHGEATGTPAPRAIDDPKLSSGMVAFDGSVLTNVAAIAAGREYSLALRKDGTVVAWGNRMFYTPVPAGLSNVVAIAVGEGYCLAITTNTNLTALKK